MQAIYLPQPTIPADEQLGRLDGKGTAIDDVTGELEMMAKKGEQDQPFLSRDPEGPGKVHSELSESTSPMTDGASGRPGNAAPNLPFGVASIEEHSASREQEAMPRGLAKENSPEVRLAEHSRRRTQAK